MSFWGDLELYIEEYCRVTKQYSNHTIRNYRNTLTRFGQFLDSIGIINTRDIDLAIVDRYRNYLNRKITKRKEKLSDKSQTYQVVILRSFFGFLRRRGMVALNPEILELPKQKSRRIDYLTQPEIYKVANFLATDSRQNITQRMRNKAMVLTIFGSGLRISEMLSLKKSDLNAKDHRLQIEGKGGKVRSTFLSPDGFQAILEYLRARGADTNPYLFINHSHNQPYEVNEFKPLSPRSVQNIIKDAAKAVGIFKHITPHTLRHSFATKILLEGGDLRSVQELLGHSNLSTTQMYTHLTDTTIRDLHKRVFGKKKDESKL